MTVAMVFVVIYISGLHALSFLVSSGSSQVNGKAASQGFLKRATPFQMSKEFHFQIGKNLGLHVKVSLL